MKVEVKTFGGLEQFMPEKKNEVQIEVVEGTTVRVLRESLGIPVNEVWMVSVNKELVKEDRVLHDGDQVTIFAPVAGG